MDGVTIQFLGQAGYLISSGGMRIVIDPYLSDSCGTKNPLFSRLHPAPISPADLEADVMIITHSHQDHLDPGTIEPYRHKDTTRFISPRLTAPALVKFGVPEDNVSVVDHAGQLVYKSVKFTGVFALGTSPDAVDTCGYLLTFPSGETVYTCSDTGWCGLLADCAPKDIDVLLVCINGKFGNLDVDQALELTRVVKPETVIPNHYDVMALNSENPETFRFFFERMGLPGQCVILESGEIFRLHKPNDVKYRP
jgi:L-ascorbate 6-phosphate lactonase